MPASSPEVWALPDGGVVEIATNAVPSALVETSVGKIEICEPCYVRGLPSFFTSRDVGEIHYQFALDYNTRGHYASAVQSLTKARQLCDTADILASLAYAEDALGNRDVAIALYEQALQLDAKHFIAHENLRKLREEHG